MTPCGPSPAPTTASDPLDFAEDYRHDTFSFPINPANMTDEEIAELMSGESEFLRDHNVIGYEIL